jgi:ribosome-associated translation inhibitor RaiA
MHEIQTVHAEEIEVIEVIEVDTDVQKAIDALNTSLGRDVTEETKKRIQYLYDKSQEKDVPFFDAVKTIHCESSWVSQKSHLPEESYGIAQIHIPSHKSVTKEQAMDAYFSIDFLVSHWYTPQAVKDRMWFGFSRATGKCTNGVQIEL